MISGGRAASISERESSLAFLKMTHYSTQPYARIDVGGKATRRCDLLPSGGAGDWRGPLQSIPEKVQVYPKNTWTRVHMPRTPYSQGPCANCGAHRLLKYAHRTMCARYKCQNAKGSIGARHGLQAAVRTTRSCHILLQDRGGARHALVRPRSTDRKEAAQQADCCRHTICYLTRCEFVWRG